MYVYYVCVSVCVSVWFDVLRGFMVFQFYPEDFFRQVDC